MLGVEPAEAINLVERVLRDLVRTVLGDGWKSHASVDLAKLEAKRTEDSAKRRGSIVSSDLLEYIEFYQLKEIIVGQWEAFAPALGKRKYVDVYLDRLDGFRNPAMHSRPLLTFERQLIEGIVGEFRNLVTIYRSTQGPDMKYYPEIEEIIDSFGRVKTNEEREGKMDREPLVVNIGDVITFQVKATDPQGRTLHWELFTGMQSDRSIATGSEATLIWKVQSNDVREKVTVQIWVKSDGEHHRYGPRGYDDFMDFYFSVPPPR
jgi:hypothetical protein